MFARWIYCFFRPTTPPSLAGVAVGIWILANVVANYIAGLLAQFTNVPKGTKPAAELAIYNDTFLIYGAAGLATAFVLFLLVPWLRRLLG